MPETEFTIQHCHIIVFYNLTLKKLFKLIPGKLKKNVSQLLKTKLINSLGKETEYAFHMHLRISKKNIGTFKSSF